MFYLFLTIWFTVFYLMLHTISRNQYYQTKKLIEMSASLANVILDEVIEETKGVKREKKIEANCQVSEPKQE